MALHAASEGMLYPSREKDAAWLATQLRASRLTLLQGQKGSGKSTLLMLGLLPRLQRRAGDRPVAETSQRHGRGLRQSFQQGPGPQPGVVIPFPDRRQREGFGPSALRGGEAVVYMKAWDSAPLETLWRELHESLCMQAGPLPGSATAMLESMAAWHRFLGVRFLIVLDDFDDCLEASAWNPAASDFIDFWVQALLDPEESSHFLIALAAPAEPLWRLLNQHMALSGDLRANRLQLAGVSLAPAPARSPESDAESASDSTFGALAASESVDDDAADFTDSDYPTGPDELDSVPDQAPDDAPSMPAPSTSARAIPRRREATTRSALFIVAAVLLVMMSSWYATRYAMGLWQQYGTAPDESASRAATSAAGPTVPLAATAEPAAPVVAALPEAGFELVADAGDKSDDMIVSDMARLLTPKGSKAPAIRFPFGWGAELTLLQDQPRLSIVTYDVLQSALGSRTARPLQVVAPLFSEEIYFLVRADSPLKYIHQIRDVRMNVGPESGSRALTAGGIYKRMFGGSIRPDRISTSTREEGLQQLLGDKSVDVLVLVGAQPDPWLTGLGEPVRSQLRLLELDTSNAASRKATASFLATRVTPARGSGLEPAGGMRTLGVMTFLVTGGSNVAGSDEQVREAANAICRNLPGLKQSGHPKWREVHPALQLETGWPVSAAAADVFRTCPTL